MSQTEDVLREKAFNEAAGKCAVRLLEINPAQLPLVIHPGKRVKSRQEIRELEAPPRESRASPAARKRPSRKERRKKAQVEEKVQKMMADAQASRDKKGRPGKSAKTLRPGKARRMNSRNDKR